MNINTDPMLFALHQAILHWEIDIVRNGRKNLGASDCPLCQMCYKEGARSGEDNCIVCRYCPIMKVTKLPACDGTPYRKVLNSLDSYCKKSMSQTERDKEFKRLSRREVDFLKYVVFPHYIKAQKDKVRWLKESKEK